MMSEPDTWEWFRPMFSLRSYRRSCRLNGHGHVGNDDRTKASIGSYGTYGSEPRHEQYKKGSMRSKDEPS